MEREEAVGSAREGMGGTMGRCEGMKVGACSVGVLRRRVVRRRMRMRVTMK
jgi:hypothetical protein